MPTALRHTFGGSHPSEPIDHGQARNQAPGRALNAGSASGSCTAVIPDSAWPPYAQDVSVWRRDMTANGAAAQGSGALEASGLGVRWRRVFPGEERQLGVLRRWLELLLPECPARSDVAYVATELGANT